MTLGVLGTGTVVAADKTPVSGSAAASTDEDAVHCVSLSCAKDDVPRDLWIAHTKAKLPGAVLVLCPDKGQNIKALLMDPAWQNFAEDHRLGLAAVMAAGRTPDGKPPRPVSGLSTAALIYQAIDHEYGGGIPVLLYGWPQQADLAAGLLAAGSKRVSGWCLRAPSHLPEIGNAGSPGVVVCYKENQQAYGTLMKDFTAGRKQGERLTWIALAGDKPIESNVLPLDIFVRNYFAALFSYKPGFEQWESIESKEVVRTVDVSTHPEGVAFLPHASLITTWATLHVPGGPAVLQQSIVEKEVDTFNKAQPKLHLYLRRPATMDPTSGRIDGVLAYCTWEGDREKIIHRLQDEHYYLVRYADEHHLALLTWNTANAFANSESADERSYQDNVKDSAGFDKLAKAWELGVHALCYETGLPEKDFLLYGLSRGAQWAHRLALRKPEHFLAVHIHVNSSYDWPTPNAKCILWLQTTGEREYGYPAALRFYVKCREMGYPIMFKAGENLGHASSPQIDRLGTRFFDYALDVKAKRDEWTVQAGKSHLGKSVSPDLYAFSGLPQAAYYADFINQEVYGADQRDLVPVSQRVPLPTKALAQAWGEMADMPVLTAVSNTAEPQNLQPAVQTGKQFNYFGSSALPAPEQNSLSMPPPAAATVGAVASPNKEITWADSVRKSEAKPGMDQPVAPEEQVPFGQDAAVPSAQAKQVSNAETAHKKGSLHEAKDNLPTDSPWSKQIAQILQEQSKAYPYYQGERWRSFSRAAKAYPTLTDLNDPVNVAFLAEYRRLSERSDNLLADPTWPERVARTVVEKLTGH